MATVCVSASASSVKAAASPTHRTVTSALARTAAIHSAHNWSSALKSRMTTDDSADWVRENSKRVRSRSHSSRGGSVVTSPPVMSAAIRS